MRARIVQARARAAIRPHPSAPLEKETAKSSYNPGVGFLSRPAQRSVPILGLSRRGPDDMGTHIGVPIRKGTMKTTVEIADPLLREVRELAAREGVTLR